MQQKLEHFRESMRGSWRYRWYALLTAALLAVLGWFVVLSIPDKFESHAQIYVDTNSVLRPLLQGIAVSSGNESNEVDVVRQALLARPTLVRVANDTGLASTAKTPEQKDRLFKKLETDISVSRDSKLGIYILGFTDSNPRVTQAVVQSLLDTFVSRATGADREDTLGAQQFLQRQVADYSARLSESEQKLAQFKKLHIGLMPDQRGDYFTRLQSEQANLERLKADLAVAQRERAELRRKLMPESSAGAGAQMPTATQIQTATVLDSQIELNNRRLEDLLLKYTDKHPDVVALRDTIARLEQRRAAEFGNVRATAATPSSANSNAGLDSVLQSIQIALDTADVKVATLQTQAGVSGRAVELLRQALTSGPEVEAELAQLNRDYGVTRTQYETLLQRLEAANISGKVGEGRDANFRIIDPPRLPVVPIAPKRVLLLTAIAVLAIAVGSGVAFVLNVLSPTFATRSGLESVTGLPVLGEIGYYPDALLLSRARASSWGVMAAVCVFIVGFMSVCVFNRTGGQIVRSLFATSTQ